MLWILSLDTQGKVHYLPASKSNFLSKAALSASTILTSGYHVRVDPDLCTACETCIERCAASVISIHDVASVDDLQCIGCGLCVSRCGLSKIPPCFLRGEAFHAKALGKAQPINITPPLGRGFNIE